METRVIIINEQGSPSVMKEDKIELHPPGKGEVLLRQTAIGLNYMDVFQLFHPILVVPIVPIAKLLVQRWQWYS